MLGSPLAMLPIQTFVKAGVFRDAKAGSGEGSAWFFEAPGVLGALKYQASTETMTSLLDGIEKTFQIAKTRVLQGFRFYWMCPSCDRSASNLFRVNQQFVCRTCFRESKSFSPARCNALILEAEDNINTDKIKLFLVTRESLEQSDDNPRYSLEPRIGKTPKVDSNLQNQFPTPLLDTANALRRGQGIGQWDVFCRYLAFAEDEIASLPSATKYSRPLSVGLMGRYPELDIRKVWKALDPLPGHAIGWALQYDDQPFRHAKMMIIDYRADEASLILFDNVGPLEDPNWQRISLHIQPDRRVRFVCPVSDKRCDVLFDRDGVFASREAQRIVHTSQRSSAKQRGPR